MKIFLTCGIGDFIAIESFLTYKERMSVDTICWATRAKESINELLPFVFPNVKEQIIVKSDWGDPFTSGFCIESKADLGFELPKDVVDINVNSVYEDIMRGARWYRGSSLASQQLASIDHINLPKDFFVIHPYSINARSTDRDLTEVEYLTAVRTLHRLGITPIIVNKGPTIVDHPWVLDLSDKLSLLESLEVVKRADGFIGCSSVFSVMASKVMASKQLYIKGHKLLADKYSKFYYAPNENTNNLVHTSLIKPIEYFGRFRKQYQSEITVNTVQGIGDIFWVYQKLAPYFSKIHFNILVLSFNAVQERSKFFITMLPKAGNISFKKVNPETYNTVSKSKYTLEDVLNLHRSFLNGEVPPLLDNPELSELTIAGTGPTVNYSVNAHLESGTNLDKIDHNSIIDHHIDLNITRSMFKNLSKEEYLCVFVAGAKRDDLWTPKEWVKLIDKIAIELDVKKIVLIGAEWDLAVQSEIKRLLPSQYETKDLVDKLDLDESIEYIRQSKYFIGYQSGLNIIADNYDVPQLMIYFDQLKPMIYTWCNQEHIGGIFQAFTFGDGVETIVKNWKNWK